MESLTVPWIREGTTIEKEEDASRDPRHPVGKMIVVSQDRRHISMSGMMIGLRMMIAGT